MKGHILITGGTGLIGSYLAGELIKSGYRVTTVSRSVGDNRHHYSMDLTDPNAVINLANTLKSVDTIIHCAAIAHGQSLPKGVSTACFNSSISRNVLEAFRGCQLRWIFISSIAVYGDLHSEHAIPLTHIAKPIDSYGIGKLSDEELFVLNCDHLSILRLMPVYDCNNLSDIVKRVLLPGTGIKILVKPSPLSNFCHLREVLTAVKEAMRQTAGQQISQVGDFQPKSHSDLVNWFPGNYVVIPQLFFRTIFFFLPSKIAFFRHIKFMLKKFALNNLYEIGSLKLKTKKD